ncbi:30S ribosomal protein S11 [Patescibacteria group bacterium]|nr:30S ribosomal protein S11 [Patescibacteria group bacterium]
MATKKKIKPTKKRKRQPAPERAQVHILASYNNTIITITDWNGNTIVTGSTGSAGFKNTRKSTPYAATVASGKIAKEAAALGVKNVDVRVRGPGIGRESAIRALRTSGLQINSISDVTPIPHNGCRPKKKRRV